VSSNLERLLFELGGRDGPGLAELLDRFRAEGTIAVDAGMVEAARELFASVRVDDEETLAAIGELTRRTGVVIDPHTAVAWEAARSTRADTSAPVVVLSTAHPAKFPDAVERATGSRPALPPHLADLLERPERATEIDADLDVLVAELDRRVGSGA
jgi:threonine synthase